VYLGTRNGDFGGEKGKKKKEEEKGGIDERLWGASPIRVRPRERKKREGGKSWEIHLFSGVSPGSRDGKRRGRGEKRKRREGKSRGRQEGRTIVYIFIEVKLLPLNDGEGRGKGKILQLKSSLTRS